MTSSIPQATLDKVTRVLHLSLVAEQFRDLKPHPSYLEPDSDVGMKARRLAEKLLAEDLITNDETVGETEIKNHIVGTKQW